MGDLMKAHETPIDGVLMVELSPYNDARGSLTRLFCREAFAEIGLREPIVQVNRSVTDRRGAVRGLHFQYPPVAETKMVTCLHGSVHDVVVDLRRGSSTFLAWHSMLLSGENRLMLYIPKGIAHGFQTLEDRSELLYFHTAAYSPDHEGGIPYDDALLKIRWPLDVTQISPRDRGHPPLSPGFRGIELR